MKAETEKMQSWAASKSHGSARKKNKQTCLPIRQDAVTALRFMTTHALACFVARPRTQFGDIMESAKSPFELSSGSTSLSRTHDLLVKHAAPHHPTALFELWQTCRRAEDDEIAASGVTTAVDAHDIATRAADAAAKRTVDEMLRRLPSGGSAAAPASEAEMTVGAVLTAVAKGTMERAPDASSSLRVKRPRDESNALQIEPIASRFPSKSATAVADALAYARSVWADKLSNRSSTTRNASGAGRQMALKYRRLLIFADAHGDAGLRRLQETLTGTSWDKQLKGDGLLGAVEKGLNVGEKEAACERAATAADEPSRG
jgi:hypothetical protein